MEKEIGRYCCLKEMRHNLPDNYKIRSALIRLIITEKTFSEYDNSNMNTCLSIKSSTDPVVPEFNHELSLNHFRKELLESKILGISDNIETANEFINKLKTISKKF